MVYVAWSLAGVGSGGLDSFGTGLVVPLAGSAAFASGRGCATGAGTTAFVPEPPPVERVETCAVFGWSGAPLVCTGVAGADVAGFGEGDAGVAVTVDVRCSDA
jgi:hypothetical protein